jgi:arylsulfatase A-like enzyme
MDRRGTRELPLPDAIHGPPTEVKPGLLRANPFRLFKEKGYVSAAIDTWHLGVDEGSEALKHGFNFRHGNDSGSGDYFTARTCCFQTSLTYFI